MTSAASMQSYPFTGVPVVHPPHLEGDPTLATEILPGPPSLASIRQLPKKPDPKRPVPLLSYLPSSDPGTTYTGLAGGMAPPLEDGGPRRKRARVDKGLSNRSQRASARVSTNGVAVTDEQQDSTSASTSQVAMDSDVQLISREELIPSLSRSVSSQNLGDSSSRSTNGRSRRAIRDKGKGKETEAERPVVLVKEEPVAVQIPDSAPATTFVVAPANEDHCSSCTSLGALVYCDGCPRAFHLWCLDPPMEAADIQEGEDRWFCPKCKVSQVPPPRPPTSFLSPLIHQVQSALPTEFQLPEDIRNFFRGVATGPRGSYVDNSNFKPPRVGRHGFGEERDPYRLRDNKGAPALCFRCNKSALPDSLTVTASSTKRPRSSVTLTPAAEQWKTIIPCDYCNLHWHIDCLDPPLLSLPSIGKKWKCPNHASNVTPKHRIPKNNNPPIEVTGPNQFNNGHIEIINSEVTAPTLEKVEEVLINGRRYRVPERVIVLDFWNKIRKTGNRDTNDASIDDISTTSSPLTSLSSLDDLDDPPPTLSLPSQLQDDDTLDLAELLCSLQSTTPRIAFRPSKLFRPTTEIGVQTEPDNSVRFERKDTEHLRGIMKAALKEAAPTPPKPSTLDTPQVNSPSKPMRTSNQGHSSSTSPSKRNRANGKRPSRARPHLASTSTITSSAVPPTAPPEASSMTNGKHTASPPTPPARSPPRAITPRTASLSDAETKPQVHSLKIRIPRLSALNHAPNNPSITPSSVPSAPKLAATSSVSPVPNVGRPRRSLRRQPSVSGSSATPSLVATGPSPKSRQLNSRAGSGDTWSSCDNPSNN